MTKFILQVYFNTRNRSKLHTVKNILYNYFIHIILKKKSYTVILNIQQIKKRKLQIYSSNVNILKYNNAALNFIITLIF